MFLKIMNDSSYGITFNRWNIPILAAFATSDIKHSQADIIGYNTLLQSGQMVKDVHAYTFVHAFQVNFENTWCAFSQYETT